jgi:DNA-directed RNA polymerase sigma subunit (sigma70/sigma32)
MIICGKSLEEELLMVRNAKYNISDEAELRNYLQPLVQSVANKYAATTGADEKMIRAGFKHLTFAMRKYLLRIEQLRIEGKEPYKFSTYFTWFIRQDIVTHLHKEA